MKRTISSDKVAIYIRWSTEDQGQGHTLEIQRESCRYYLLSQGWIPQDGLTFIDEGWSGSSLERPALTALRSAVAAGQVECVVVYKLDRLSRNVKDMLNLVLGDWEDVCSVRSTQEPVDTTSDAGRMFFTMLGSFADFERATIKTRTWSGKLKNAQKGRNPGHVYPYGYQRAEEGGGWEVSASEAVVVRRIFASYIRGLSCRAIAAELNDEGFRTRAGVEWSDATIARMLRNPIYCGRLEYNRRDYAGRKKRGRVVLKDASEVIVVQEAVPALVEPSVWEQVERLRGERPRVGRGVSPRTGSSPFLLSGLLKCPCGHSWVGIYGGPKGERRFYACAGSRTKGFAKCASRSIKMETLDAFVVERVRATWPIKGEFHEEIFSGLAQRLREHEVRVSGLRGRLGSLEGSQERFREDYKAGRITAEIYMELLKDARQEREELTRQLDRAATERREILASQVDLEHAAGWYAKLDAWEALALEERQQVLRMLVERIEVSRTKGSKDASVHIHWKLAGPQGQVAVTRLP